MYSHARLEMYASYFSERGIITPVGTTTNVTMTQQLRIIQFYVEKEKKKNFLSFCYQQNELIDKFLDQ